MKKVARRAHLKMLIFAAIGVCNTLLDIVLYTILRKAGQSVLTANVISVSAALIMSYLLNSRYTFQSRSWTVCQFVAFVGVTLFGLWVLQTAIIYALNPLVQNLPTAVWQLAGSLASTAKIVVPKLLATGVTLVWNYVWYNKVIFRRSQRKVGTTVVKSEPYSL